MTIADVQFATTHPRLPSVMMMIDPQKLSSLPKKIQRVLTEAGMAVTNMVPRGEGVVVLCCEERALWRGRYGEPLGTKFCLGCGADLSEEIVATKRFGHADSEIGALLHFCESCPKDMPP